MTYAHATSRIRVVIGVYFVYAYYMDCLFNYDLDDTYATTRVTGMGMTLGVPPTIATNVLIKYTYVKGMRILATPYEIEGYGLAIFGLFCGDGVATTAIV